MFSFRFAVGVKEHRDINVTFLIEPHVAQKENEAVKTISEDSQFKITRWNPFSMRSEHFNMNSERSALADRMMENILT